MESSATSVSNSCGQEPVICALVIDRCAFSSPQKRPGPGLCVPQSSPRAELWRFRARRLGFLGSRCAVVEREVCRRARGVSTLVAPRPFERQPSLYNAKMRKETLHASGVRARGIKRTANTANPRSFARRVGGGYEKYVCSRSSDKYENTKGSKTVEELSIACRTVRLSKLNRAVRESSGSPEA